MLHYSKNTGLRSHLETVSASFNARKMFARQQLHNEC